MNADISEASLERNSSFGKAKNSLWEFLLLVVFQTEVSTMDESLEVCDKCLALL